MLPSGSGAKLGVKRVGVAGWEVISWVVGVGGTMVVTDTLSTDRQWDDTQIHKYYYLQRAVTFQPRHCGVL